MNKPQKVAVFFQLEPGQKIVGEGIAQYINRVIGGYCELGTEVNIYCPRWARSQMQNFVNWSGFPSRQIHVRYFGSALLGAALNFRKKSRNDEHETKVFEDPDYKPKNLGDVLIDNAPLLSFLTLLLPIFVLLSPLLVVPLLFLLVGRRLFGGVASRLTKLLLMVLKLTAYAQMAAAIDRNRRIEVCIVPIGTWSMCRLVRKTPVVVQIPDVVWLEFPKYFPPTQELSNNLREMRKVAFHAKAVVCPSNHVRRRHLVNLLGVPTDKARTCFHGPMTVNDDLRRCGDEVITKDVARQKLGDAITHALNNDDGTYAKRIGYNFQRETALRGFASDARPLLYYPTQNRPYKNFEGLFSALYEIKLKHGKRVRLMLTADLSLSPRLMALIDQLDLSSEIILLPRLPQNLHALAYVACDLAVSASYFEGGFTFVFSEALSADRPCLASDIPASREIIPVDLVSRTLFNPASASHLSSLIVAGLRDCESLLRDQKAFQIARVSSRSWSDVARDYWQFARGN